MSESSGTESPSGEDFEASGADGATRFKPVPSAPVAEKPKRGLFKRFVATVGTALGIVGGVLYHVGEQNPAPTTSPRNPDTNERLVVPLGCKLDQYRNAEDRECVINSGIDPDSLPAGVSPDAAAYPRTYIEPLPEGQSGRVGYSRVSTQAQATPTDLGVSLSLTLK